MSNGSYDWSQLYSQSVDNVEATLELPPVRQKSYWESSVASSVLDNSTTVVGGGGVGGRRKLLPNSTFSSILDLSDVHVATSSAAASGARARGCRQAGRYNNAAAANAVTTPRCTGTVRDSTGTVRDSLGSPVLVRPRHIDVPSSVQFGTTPTATSAAAAAALDKTTSANTECKSTCQFCRKALCTKNIDRHMKLFCPLRPTQCHVCGKTLKANSLNGHLAVHARKLETSVSEACHSTLVNSRGDTATRLAPMDGMFRRPLSPPPETRASIKKPITHPPALSAATASAAAAAAAAAKRSAATVSSSVLKRSRCGQHSPANSTASVTASRSTVCPPPAAHDSTTPTVAKAEASLRHASDTMELTPVVRQLRATRSRSRADVTSSLSDLSMWMSQVADKRTVSRPLEARATRAESSVTGAKPTVTGAELNGLLGDRGCGATASPQQHSMTSVFSLDSDQISKNLSRTGADVCRPYMSLDGSLDVMFVRVHPSCYSDPMVLTDHHMTCVIIAGQCHVIEDGATSPMMKAGSFFHLPNGKRYELENCGSCDLIVQCTKVKVKPDSCHFLPLMSSESFQRCLADEAPELPAICQ